MARKQEFLDAEFAETFEEAYAKLQTQQQGGCDKVIMALLKRQPTPGMRVKPIEPDKYYYEARINDGDRLIHRIDEGTLFVYDVVTHDEIGTYGRGPKRDAKR